MKTAEEWYRKINSYSFPEYMNDVHRDWIMKMINEIRIECINECAKSAKARIIDRKAFVDRQSILKLKEQIK